MYYQGAYGDNLMDVVYRHLILKEINFHVHHVNNMRGTKWWTNRYRNKEMPCGPEFGIGSSKDQSDIQQMGPGV